MSDDSRREGSILDDERLDLIAARARERDGDRAVLLNTLVMAEETGEAVQQIRRYLGHGRTCARPSDVAEEMADVIISTLVTARLLDIDVRSAVEAKLTAIMDRGGR